MKKLKKFTVSAVLGLLVLALSATGLMAASPPQPTYGRANVDGSPGDWNLVDDFFANMYRAGDPTKKVESKLYLRYDCTDQVLYALVLVEDGVLGLEQPGDAWLKIDGRPGNLIDGTMDDFAWVRDGQGNVIGWEGSAPLDPGDYLFIAHIQVLDEGSQTSATDRKTDQRGIRLLIECDGGPTPTPAIDIEKSTNGYDADMAPGPEILVGEAVTWKYVVKNTGDVALSSVTVLDDQGAMPTFSRELSGDGDSLFEPGEIWEYTASGIAVEGQYKNKGTVEAYYNDTKVSDMDPSHYFGAKPANPAIDIEKSTNGYDADMAPGPEILVGEAVTWKYVVKNTGDVALSSVTVLDDQGAMPTFSRELSGDGDSLFEPGEIWEYMASGIAVEGQYKNKGIAKAYYNDTKVSDMDPSHYFGARPEIDVEKFVSGSDSGPWYDADDPAGPKFAPDADVYFKFWVKNTGNVALTSIKLSDSDFDTSSCTLTDPLAVGAYFDCVVGPFMAGDIADYPAYGVDHVNTAMTSGNYTDSSGKTTIVDDSDAAHADVLPSIEVTKTPSRATIPPSGAYVEFQVSVKNTSGEAVMIGSIMDNVYGDILDPDNGQIIGTDCSATSIDAGDTYVCGFTVFVDGGAVGDMLTDVVWVTAKDDEGNKASDSDDATVMVKEGDGVGTPGYWKSQGADLIPDKLLIGDWNLNGVCDLWEGCIELTKEDALFLLDAKNYNEGADKRYTLVRSLVAAWLNVSVAGNDFVCIESAISDGIDWLMLNGNPLDGGMAVKGQHWSMTGEPIYLALDEYNNTGAGCAIDRDSDGG